MIFFLKKIYYSIFNKDYNFTKTLINQYYTGKKKTVLSFSSIGAGTKHIQNEEFFNLTKKHNVLFIRDITRSWFNNVDAKLIKKNISKKLCYAIGHSMGGFNAIIFSTLHNVQKVIAFSPQFSIHPNITKIYVRHDDLFITKIMGQIDKSWNGKIAWMSNDNSIEVNFNDVIVNKDVNNDDDDDNNIEDNDENKIIMIKIDETFNYQKIETIKQNMNKKQISYKCKIDFYENEDCDDTEFIDLIKPKLYQSYYYDTNIKLDVQDVFSYEYIIIGPEEDKELFEKTMHDFYENKDHKKYIQNIILNVL